MFAPITTSTAEAQKRNLSAIPASGCFGMLTLPAMRARPSAMTHERYQALMTGRRIKAMAFNWPIAA